MVGTAYPSHHTQDSQSKGVDLSQQHKQTNSPFHLLALPHSADVHTNWLQGIDKTVQCTQPAHQLSLLLCYPTKYFIDFVQLIPLNWVIFLL